MPEQSSAKNSESTARTTRSIRRVLNLFPTIVIAFPFAALYFLIAETVARNRLRRDASVSRCRNCDATLGQASLRLADQYWSEHVRSLREKYPGIRLRLVRNIHAICEHCGTPHRYGRADRNFVVTKLRGSGPVTQHDNPNLPQ
ncbi:MAG: hypothetical protein AAFU85_21320 [Planctomycetota bacterium]